MTTKAKEKPKPPVTSIPSSPPPPLEDLFSNLHRHSQNSEFKQAVRVADQILSIAPGDEDAMRCKIVALIKSDDIDRALATVQASEKLPIDISFYKAYCLYRQNKLNEALEVLRGLEKNASVLQLEAQVLYRLGKTDACADSYEKLQKLKIDSLDLKTNIIAALISAGRASDVQGVVDPQKVTSSRSFELVYNTACSLIEKMKYSDAEKLLLAARRMGQEMLMEDDFAEEEIENELAPIAVQLAYVQQLMGQPQEALEAYTDILNRNLSDASSLAIATNNLIALKGAKDVSDGLKKLDRFIEKGAGSQRFQLAQGLELKLSSRQKEAIYANRLLLVLQANKLDQARELEAAISEMFCDTLISALLKASLLARENKATKAEETLEQFANRFPDKAKPALLALAQLAAASNHPLVAANSLSRIPEIQHLPAAVATCVALLERAGALDKAYALLDAALRQWSNSKADVPKLELIVYAAASFKLKHGLFVEAAKLYDEAVRRFGGVEALVGAVIAAARAGQIEMAESFEHKLRALSSVDVDSLEKSSGAGVMGKPIEVASLSIEEEEKAKARAKRRKRKRKPRYPKGFDPANPGPMPDPERWLPKRERSSYRPKRKDKRAAQVRGSQGSVVREGPAKGGGSQSGSHQSGNAEASTSNKAPVAGSKSRKKSRF